MTSGRSPGGPPSSLRSVSPACPCPTSCPHRRGRRNLGEGLSTTSTGCSGARARARSSIGKRTGRGGSGKCERTRSEKPRGAGRTGTEKAERVGETKRTTAARVRATTGAAKTAGEPARRARVASTAPGARETTRTIGPEPAPRWMGSAGARAEVCPRATEQSRCEGGRWVRPSGASRPETSWRQHCSRASWPRNRCGNSSSRQPPRSSCWACSVERAAEETQTPGTTTGTRE
mmetsp:Transcript_7644/g.18482  ORF Transcript_7644/g.18482 Transcript_7644/m.18482 type:complete len:233 (+) Transcript_7644:1567-2265(+)